MPSAPRVSRDAPSEGSLRPGDPAGTLESEPRHRAGVWGTGFAADALVLGRDSPGEPSAGLAPERSRVDWGWERNPANYRLSSGGFLPARPELTR